MKQGTRKIPANQIPVIAFAFCVALTGCFAGGNTNTKPGLENVPQSQNANNKSAEPSRTPATEQKNLLFIVDSSGSMKTKAGNKTKMEAAKEVVTELIEQLPSGVQAGLMAYGHRQKNDCKDVELLVGIGTVQPDVFRQKVQSLQPLGETPISFSIRQAADVLKGRSGKKTVILISDGEETCKEDPCAIAAELKREDIDLQVHVVGFGIDKPIAKKQLNCIAEATGGTYKDAGNAAELKETLEGMAQATESNGDKGRLITVSRDSNGEPLDYSVEIYPAGKGGQPLNSGIESWKSTKINEIPPGNYDVKYWTPGLPDVWKRNVEIKAGQDKRVEIEQFGRVRVSIKDQNGKAVRMYGDVYLSSAPDQQLVAIDYAATTQELPPGIYDIRFWNIGIRTQKNGVEIKAGQETVVEVTVNQ